MAEGAASRKILAKPVGRCALSAAGGACGGAFTAAFAFALAAAESGTAICSVSTGVAFGRTALLRTMMLNDLQL